MSLHDWAKAGWLRPHQTSRRQIADLFAIVDRDLEDAARGLSADWQFGIAYNAALKLCRSSSVPSAKRTPTISTPAAPSETPPNTTHRDKSAPKRPRNWPPSPGNCAKWS